MRNRIISAICLAVIIGSTHYAWSRESLRETDPVKVFEEINQNYFNGELRARIQWGRAVDADAYGETFFNDRVTILLDEHFITDADQMRETVEHEACHVKLGPADGDKHGAEFQACMARFR